MTPVAFSEANARYGPPEGLAESQVRTIHAWHGECRASCDGMKLVVVAHRPTPEDLKRLNEGGVIFLSMVGGLAPHFLTTSFAEATNNA